MTNRRARPSRRARVATVTVAAAIAVAGIVVPEIAAPAATSTVPPAPTLTSVAPGLEGRMLVKWTAPTGTFSPAVTSYQYKVATTSDGGGTWSAYSAAMTLKSTAGSKQVACNAPATARGGCKFRVYAINSIGTSASSAEKWSLWKPPSAPRSPAGSGRIGPRLTNIAWKAPSASGGLPQTDVRYQISTDGGATWPTAAVSLLPGNTTGVITAPSGCDTGLDCRVRLYAVNGAGTSPVSLVSAKIGWHRGSSTLGIATGTPYVPSGMTETQFWDRVATMYAGWVRLDCSPSSYTTYTSCDGKAAQAQRIGVKLVVTFTYRPSGYGGTTFDAAERQQWATWAGQTAGHLTSAYPNVVGAWEIWNEPNNFEFWDPVDPVAYADLLVKSAAAIRPVSTMPILTGGLSPGGGNGSSTSTTNVANPATFLSRVYAAGARNAFDAVGAHPYDSGSSVTNQGPPNVSWSSGFRATHWLRKVMNANGDSAKKLWGTEAGTASCGSYPSGSNQTMSESQRVTRLRNDVNDWFHGVHDPNTGATTGTSATGDWNTGPFMVFKMHKAYDGAPMGLIYMGQCAKPKFYEPPVVQTMRDLAAS